MQNNTNLQTINLFGKDGSQHTFNNAEMKGMHKGYYVFAEKTGEGTLPGGTGRVQSFYTYTVKADEVESIYFGEDVVDAEVNLSTTLFEAQVAV